jgi:hypothetical protein
MVIAGSYHAVRASKIAPPSIPAGATVPLRGNLAVMALDEGFRRIRTVGKAILATGLLLDLFLIIGLLVSAFGGQALAFFPIGAFGIPLTVAGILVLLGIWVAEGFVVPRQPPRG